MTLKPIIIWGHAFGPNPWKVFIICKELNLPFEFKVLEAAEMKQPPFEAKNPNGRVPAIDDPNTSVTIFESGAILEYLVEQYDTDHKLGYDDPSRRWLARSWLYFQVSGQGPYIGQFYWFKVKHPEKVDSAITRYYDETKRILSVFERHLAGQGSQFLLGDKCTYADLAFVPWNKISVDMLTPEVEIAKDYPHFMAWHERLVDRPSVKEMVEYKAKISQK